MSDTLFLALVGVFVTNFLAIRFVSVAGRRRVPIAVNCPIDRALILLLVLIVVGLSLRSRLSNCKVFLYLHRSLPSARIQGSQISWSFALDACYSLFSARLDHPTILLLSFVIDPPWTTLFPRVCAHLFSSLKSSTLPQQL